VEKEENVWRGFRRLNIEGEVEGYLAQIEYVAPSYAQAKANTYQLQEFKKTQRSLLYGKAVGKTVADKENWVSMQPEVAESIRGVSVAIEREERLRWELKVAELHIEVWRTEQANRRLETKLI
jgi:hypothetical protein